MLRVTASAPIFPSEDPEKVRHALLELFPDATVEAAGDRLVARTESLDPLRTVLHRQRILDAARRALLRSLDADGTSARFRLNKQAAYHGRVSFSDDPTAALGEIEVLVEGERLEALFKEMAPMTIRGIPVSEERAERESAKRRAARETVSDVRERAKEVEAEDPDLDHVLDGEAEE